ncbi:MAG: hypothetical protein FWB96_01995 [Defluviitaleaceae bacterium]|nr:hypothetical protein [Defluviitaleaceae bacterium]MCL2262018.1 hypothetical protein [Defluviitaleaceae bacterium]
MKRIFANALIKRTLFGTLYILGSILFIYFFVSWVNEIRAIAINTGSGLHTYFLMLFVPFVIGVVFSAGHIRQVVLQIVKKRGIEIKFSRLIFALLMVFLVVHFRFAEQRIDWLMRFWPIYASTYGGIIYYSAFWYNLIYSIGVSSENPDLTP